ncbi:unnamed protein product [Mytilus coruscus]|uniref:Uncharacterized protein n=1 Tax=Mytilus coruscus TaxID=42192 RepID=A0A6J8D6B1_MYTCO|nr:unnamed protein product [Mytilus coruscus]
MPTLPHNPDNTVHIPDMSPVPLPWQPMDPQPTCDNTEFVSQTGFDIDTVEMVVRIPKDKLIKLKSLLEPILFNKKIKQKDLESVVGLMAFCSRAITSSRAFLRRYEAILFSSAFSVEFFARVSEMTTASCREGFNETNHAIKIGNVEVTNHNIRIYLASSKTDQLGRGTSIIVARQSESHDGMMTCRLRINSAIASFVLQHEGHYIKYPDIFPTSTFLKKDGVHLTDLGNDIFLNTLQGALEMFICSGSSTYPDKFSLNQYWSTAQSQLYPHLSGG